MSSHVLHECTAQQNASNVILVNFWFCQKVHFKRQIFCEGNEMYFLQCWCKTYKVCKNRNKIVV